MGRHRRWYNHERACFEGRTVELAQNGKVRDGEHMAFGTLVREVRKIP